MLALNLYDGRHILRHRTVFLSTQSCDDSLLSSKQKTRGHCTHFHVCDHDMLLHILRPNSSKANTLARLHYPNQAMPDALLLLEVYKCSWQFSYSVERC